MAFSEKGHKDAKSKIALKLSVAVGLRRESAFPRVINEVVDVAAVPESPTVYAGAEFRGLYRARQDGQYASIPATLRIDAEE
jgi:hypothetical protein